MALLSDTEVGLRPEKPPGETTAREVPLSQFFGKEAAPPESSSALDVITVVLALAAVALITFVLRECVARVWRRTRAHKRVIAACVTGWLLWAFLVWTYAMVTGGLRDDDRYWSAVILPPLGAILTWAWLRRFILKR